MKYTWTSKICQDQGLSKLVVDFDKGYPFNVKYKHDSNRIHIFVSFNSYHYFCARHVATRLILFSDTSNSRELNHMNDMMTYKHIHYVYYSCNHLYNMGPSNTPIIYIYIYTFTLLCAVWVFWQCIMGDFPAASFMEYLRWVIADQTIVMMVCAIRRVGGFRRALIKSNITLHKTTEMLVHFLVHYICKLQILSLFNIISHNQQILSRI